MPRKGWRAAATKRWPDAIDMLGNGRYATVCPCRDLTVHLHKTLAQAQAKLEALSPSGCGGKCFRPETHYLFDLEAEEIVGWGPPRRAAAAR